MDIWKLNIQRLRHINEHSEDKRPLEIVDSHVLNFAAAQFDESKKRKAGHWNGRQIRNAFQVARSLAYYDTCGDAEVKDINSRSAVLDVKYFRMMHDITEDFDHYMLEVHAGMDDGKIALEMEHRADHFRHPRPYRSREEFDDQYNDYNQRASFDMIPAQGFSSRRSTGHNNPRPSLSIPKTSQRYSPNSFVSPLTTAYDESIIDDKTSGTLGATSPRLGQRHPFPASEGPTAEFRAGLASEGDYPFQASGTVSRLASGFGTSAPSRAFDRGGASYGLGRDALARGRFDADEGYRMDRNEFGKRERS